MYPVTIVKSRYGGAYEGGAWIAFHLDADKLPWQAFDDDNTCANWWAQPPNMRFVGRGSTPTEAYEDLIHRNS